MKKVVYHGVMAGLWLALLAYCTFYLSFCAKGQERTEKICFSAEKILADMGMLRRGRG